MTGIVIPMFFGEPFGGIITGARGAVLSALLRTATPMTGRQIHALVSDEYSLWSVQQTLKALAELGIIETQTIGRAGVHTIDEEHAAIPHLRHLADPIGALSHVILDAIGEAVETVLIFGSIARGEATENSDIDLAVITDAEWDGRVDLQEVVRKRFGNACDVLVFTVDEFNQLAKAGEPVVHDILRDGLALVGTKPRTKAGAA